MPRITNPAAARDRVAYMDAVRASAFGAEYKAQAQQLLRVAPGDTVLDLGCGPGDDTRALALAASPTGCAVGIDTDPIMLRAARLRGTDARFLRGSGLALPFPDDVFAACYADRVFQLLEGRQRDVLSEIARVLQPGGRLVVCSPDVRSFVLEVGEPETTATILAQLGRQSRWGGRQLNSSLTAAGFEEVHVDHLAATETNLRAINTHTPLSFLARLAEEAGVISADEAESWLEAVSKADESESLRFTSTMFVARGRQPRERQASRPAR